MKTRILIALIIAVLSLAIYPAMEQIADKERGYDSNCFGGEEILLFAGLGSASFVLMDGSSINEEEQDEENTESEGKE